MFLGGTIVLSIAASFFGATGIMGLKYIQSDCYDEVNLYFDNPSEYLGESIEYADEAFYDSRRKPTQESLYGLYSDNIIGEPYIFTAEIDSDKTLYVFSIIYKNKQTRQQLLDMKIKTAEFTYSSTTGKLTGLTTVATEASCFHTVGGFDEINGILTCGIRYSQFQQAYGRYEEAKKTIVDREQCAHQENQIKCDTDSPSFPLCCKQFSEEYTWTEGCACINSPTDASCEFKKDIVDCVYDKKTLDISKDPQREYYCGSSTSGWCEKDSLSFIWDKKCNSETTVDGKYDCCQAANVWSSSLKERKWEKWGKEIVVDMVPSTCKQFDECHSSSDFNNGCCSEVDHTDCKICKAGPTDATEESEHARDCGYTRCLSGNLQDQMKCCLDVETLYSFKFPANSICRKAIDYEPCDDLTQNSLACQTISDSCKRTQECFPNCCNGKNFDFATVDTIKRSAASHCFQEASEKIGQINEKNNLLGLYIYHQTGAEGSSRESCKKVNGIIDPKCCHKTLAYDPEDPCYCHGIGADTDACTKIHHKQCLPGDDAYPQCCFDIGDFFGDDHFCKCRFEDVEKNLIGENPECNEVDTSKPSFEFIDKCPNPCLGGKALIDGNSLICEMPIFKL